MIFIMGGANAVWQCRQTARNGVQIHADVNVTLHLGSNERKRHNKYFLFDGATTWKFSVDEANAVGPSSCVQKSIETWSCH